MKPHSFVVQHADPACGRCGQSVLHHVGGCTFVVCSTCDGTGVMLAQRYFRKLGHPAQGVLHLATHLAYGRTDVWVCGCGTATYQRRHTQVEWLAKRGTHKPCTWLANRIARGDNLP